jgi:DNA-binding PadR family transcriptional regulator
MAKKIGTREESLFVALHDLVFVDYPYLVNYVYVLENGGSLHKNTIMNHLRSLEKEGYIQSFPVAKANVRGNDRLVYTLNTKGVQEAREILGEVDWDMRWTERTPTYIYHSLRMANILAIYEKARFPGIQFHEYFSERRAFRNYGEYKMDRDGKKRRPSTTVIRPDGAFILKRTVNDKVFHFLYFVEMERSRQRIENTMEKIFRYNEYVRSKAFENDLRFGVKIDLIRVLFVSERANERDQLWRNAQKADAREIENLSGALLFATYEDVMENPYGEVWKAKHSKDPNQSYTLAQRIQVDQS